MQVLYLYIYIYICVFICCWHQNPTAQHETTSRRQASMATIRSKSFTFASLAMLSKGPLMSVITKPRTLLRWSDRQTAQISTVWSAMVERDRTPSGNQETNWFCDVFFKSHKKFFPMLCRRTTAVLLGHFHSVPGLLVQCDFLAIRTDWGYQHTVWIFAMIW